MLVDCVLKEFQVSKKKGVAGNFESKTHMLLYNPRCVIGSYSLVLKLYKKARHALSQPFLIHPYRVLAHLGIEHRLNTVAEVCAFDHTAHRIGTAQRKGAQQVIKLKTVYGASLTFRCHLIKFTWYALPE